MNPAALLLMNLGKQMLFDIRSCAYLWSRLFIMSQSTGESFVTNARKDYSNSVECANEPSKNISTRPVICEMCGAVAGEPHAFDPGRKTRLHLDHVIDKSMGGVDEAHNLRAICSVCNEGASNVTLQRPELNKLLVQVRRATALDQRELLLWLTKKFSSTKVQ